MAAVDAASRQAEKERICAMTRLRIYATALTVLANVIVGNACAIAQVLPPAELNWPPLTAGDFDRMHAAAGLLYQGRPVGSIENWRNPKTDNAGSVTLTGDFATKGMPCRTMTYRIRLKHSVDDPSRYVISWCKLSDGSWKILDRASTR